MLATDLAPSTENCQIKSSMTKKGHQKFWQIDDILVGNAEFVLCFSGNALKKGQ